MPRQVILTGHVYGTIDWVTDDGSEVGMFVKSHTGQQSRCVLQGTAVKGLIATRALRQGVEVTAFGELTARIITLGGVLTTEMICLSSYVAPEAFAGRVRAGGRVQACCKGVALSWDERLQQLKTFINSEAPGRPKSLAVSHFMGEWLGRLGDATRITEQFRMRGREYTAMGHVQAINYRDRNGVPTPCIQMLTADLMMAG